MKPTLAISFRSSPVQYILVPIYEFHISRLARLKYRVDEALFESSGNVIFPNFRAVRELAFSLNQVQERREPQKQIRAGKLNAMGLLDEINHFLVRYYDDRENAGAITRAYQHIEQKIGKEAFEKTLLTFLTEFPPKAVYQNQRKLQEYFEGQSAGKRNKEVAFEELMMLHIANFNPACNQFKELFDDSSVKEKSAYQAVVLEAERFFSKEKPFGPDNQTLIEALKKPILLHPESLEAQLGYFKERWGIILSPKFLERILRSLELSKEEEKYLWNLLHPFGGTPVVETFVPEYRRRGTKPEDFLYDEFERFTPDIDWMPNVVLLAKNIYVWLDQLSKKYQRQIRRLNEIPDEELDQLARWNFTGLWLIGVWERSNASKKIKQINGNPEAVSSAYSLYDYEIAYDLGGEEAFHNFSERAWQRGIRLAGDMVPNHMGLYSKWVSEHPEYFIQLNYPPYPNYKFTGHNLSDDPNIELRIEDGYWNRSDAAVVFQRVDRRTGEVKYIYHGNDGTSMPWNDTAQLNLLRADVREAIIQNIFHVAKKFSVIRFDAAMTLAKKHFQRLWYPMPGTSGVPSRQEYGVSREEFDAQFPNEFWREVVDRINSEMPHTLLLAEAFWLMEGYFVRTLGMHRVYNSAFMHMLMKEENQKFRALIKNTLEFNPEILKRYVNFMSNPDEQTAIAQFGKDDKYFGVATLMVTLPGLPMFAHGQIEGFTEKYGMEYQKAYYNEIPDEWSVRRHEHEIFPLMRKRYLFSQVRNFEFYDFLDDRGFVNENVFAFTNRTGNEAAVVLFHNKFEECSGYIKHSLQKNIGEEKALRSVTLAEALNIHSSNNTFYRFRERKSNLEYLVAGNSIADKGWRIELRAFQYAVFTDFAKLYDESGVLAEVAQQLDGKGTANLDFMIQKILLRPFHNAVRSAYVHFGDTKRNTFVENYMHCFTELEKYLNQKLITTDEKDKLTNFIKKEELFFQANDQKKIEPLLKKYLSQQHIVFYYLLERCQNILKTAPVEKLQLDAVIQEIFHQANVSTWDNAQLLKLLLSHYDTIVSPALPIPNLIERLLHDFSTADFLGVNLHKDVLYYNKEKFELLITWILVLRLMYSENVFWDVDSFEKGKSIYIELLSSILSLSTLSEYRVEKLKELSVASAHIQKISKKFTDKRNSKKISLKSVNKKKKSSSAVKKVTKRAKKKTRH